MTRALERYKRLFVPEYSELIRGIPGLIGYWQLDEKQGLVAWEQTSLHGAMVAKHGTHVGTTPYQPGIGDGRISQYYDALNDFTNVFTVPFQAAFAAANDPSPVVDVSEGTMAIWARVNGVGVWTDGLAHYIIQLGVDGNNRITIISPAVPNNQLLWYYIAGGVVLFQGRASAEIDFMCLVLTWSASAGATGEMRAFFNGVQVGAPVVNLGTWAGTLVAVLTNIGCYSSVGPVNVWHGTEAHGFVLNRAAPPDEVAYWAEV